MINRLIKMFAKKWAKDALNEVLKDKEKDMQKVITTTKVWTTRLEKILAALQSLLQKLDDNKITDEEIDQSISEIRKLIEEM